MISCVFNFISFMLIHYQIPDQLWGCCMNSPPTEEGLWPAISINLGMRIKNLNPLGLVVALLAVMLVGCASPPVTPPQTADRPSATSRNFTHATGAWLASQQGQECTLDLRGPIDESAVRQARVAMQWVEDAGCSRKTLVLNGRHGVVNEAITLGSMVRNRGYDTWIKAGGECGTPCLLVFTAGTQRWLTQGPTPAQLVQTQIPPDRDFGQRICQTELSRGQQLTLLRYLRAMLPETTALTVYRKLETADCNTAERFGPAQAISMGLATGAR